MRKTGDLLHLPPQPFKVLVLLISRAGQLITREEFREQIWGNETFVDFEHGLNFAIKKIRDTLGDDAEHPRYVETLPRRGYRFIAAVEWLDHVASGREPPTNLVTAQPPAYLNGGAGSSAAVTGTITPFEASSAVRARWQLWMTLAIGLVTLLGAVAWIAHRPLPPPRITDYVRLTRDNSFKEVAGADSNRIYVNLLLPDSLEQIPLSGGELVPVPVRIPGEERPIPGLAPNDFPYLFDISADGVSLLCWGPAYSLWSVTNTGNPIRYFGPAQGAAWSPDGKSLVYSWNGDVFVLRSDASDSRLIVSSKAFEDPAVSNSDFSWSPDGGRIRFTRSHEIWEVFPSGSGLHRLLIGWRPSSWKTSGRWTADGHFFLFLTGEPNSIPLMSGTQLWALDERRPWFGSAILDPIQLTSGPTHWGRPVTSRDGTRIFARGVVLDGELIRFDQQTKKWEKYLGGRSAEEVTLAPDGKSAAYAAFPEEVLYRASLDGTAVMQLTQPPLAVKFARWSPDGKQILICAQMGISSIEMYLVPAEGGPPARVIADDPEPEMDSTWSPDSRRIAYSSSGNSWEALHRVEIRIFDLASGKTTALPGSGEEFSPRWSPDGRHIAALTISEHKLKVFDLALRQWKTLYAATANFPTWSRTGQFIYFENWQNDILRISAQGGKTETIAPLKDVPVTGSFGNWFGLDPDDAPLILRDKGTDEVYALILAGQKAHN